MAFRLILSPAADATLDKLDPEVRRHVLDQIDILAESPVRLSRPARFPFPENCQLFRCEPLQRGEVQVEVNIMFRYGQDEESLQILTIGHYELE